MSIDNGQKVLGSLFVDNILRVPQFQRAYAWEKEPHLRNFFEDLCNHPRRGDKKYFFGTILLTTSNNVQSPLYTGYDIVDGQQRLTTATIFVASAVAMLRSDTRYQDNANDYFERFIQKRQIRKLHTIAEDDAFFERFIVGANVARDDACVTPSQRRLLQAKRYFDSILADQPTFEIDGLLSILWSSQILVYAVTSNAEATQIFELQNDRGKRLTNLEALKSFLMHGLYMHAGDDTESDLAIVQGDFAEIYRTVETLETKYDAPDEDQILSYHCIAFEQWLTVEGGATGWEKPKQLVRQLLLDHLGQGAAATWIKQFSHRLKDTFKYALQIIDARDSGSCVPLGDLTVLGRTAAYWPLLLKCWGLDSSQNQRPDFPEVVTLMVSFTFRAMIAGKRSDTGEPELRRLARDFSGQFTALLSDLKRMRDGWEIPIYFPIGLGSVDFYGWGRIATYLLWRYENHLRAQTGRQAPSLSWRTIVAPANQAVTYEKDHIEPKNKANPTLARLVKWNPVDIEARPFSEIYLNRLGNLVLDTYSTGAAKGSGDFLRRIPHYTNSTFLSQSEIVSRFATNNPSGTPLWDESAIRRRHDVLVAYATNFL